MNATIPDLEQLYEQAAQLAVSGDYDGARKAYEQLEVGDTSGVWNRRIANDRGVLDAVEGRATTADQFQPAITGDIDWKLPQDNLDLWLSRRNSSAPTTDQTDHPKTRVALVSFLFNWPSTGGGIVHTVELAQFLERAGYDVQLIHPAFPPWDIGAVDATCPFPTHAITMSSTEWTAAGIQQKLRRAVDEYQPDFVILTDCWNMKPVLAEALSEYRVIWRMQALECVCPLNNLRLLIGDAGLQQCDRDQLSDPAGCQKCVSQLAHTSGQLHAEERRLSGWGTDEYQALLQRTLRQAEAVLVLNSSMAEIYRQAGISARVVTWGMDATRFPWPLPEEPPLGECERFTTILFAGLTREPIKGFDVLQAACRQLWEQRQDFRVVITDELPENADPFLVSVGWQPQSTLPRYYRATDFTVVPTIAQDGLSRTSVEAMASGRPVIGSRIGGVPETVIDGVTGLLAEPGNVDDWVSKISRLLDDPGLRERLGTAGRQRFDNCFRWEAVIELQYAPLLQTVSQSKG